MWWFSNHQVGQVGFLRVLRFPTQKLWKRNESLFNKYYFFTWSLLFLCLINFVLILLLLCDLVLFCTYVSGFDFNMTMVELIESVFNHKLVFIMETLLYMYVWSCGDLFWYTFDSEIFINWTNQLKWYSLSSWFIFLYLYSPQQRMGRTSKSTVYGQNI